MVDKMRVGFIGAGLMGAGMAGCAQRAGHPLTVLVHRNRGPVEPLLAAGAAEARNPRELAERSDAVVLCVTGTPQVEAVVFGPDGVMAAARPGLVVIDTSTAEPPSTLKVAAALREAGAEFADAPLGGTPSQAAEGKLTTMVGADEALFARIEPLLLTWATKATRVGPVGAGHTMKLLNNFLALGYAAIYAEATAIGAKAGVTLDTFDSVIRGSRMDCGFYQTFMASALHGDREAHRFTLVNALKDTRYLGALADGVGVAAPVADAVKTLYALAVGAGRGADYVPALVEVVAALNAGGDAPARA